MTDENSWTSGVRRIMVTERQEVRGRIVAWMASEAFDESDLLGRLLTDPRPDLIVLGRIVAGDPPEPMISTIRDLETQAGLAPVPLHILSAENSRVHWFGLLEARGDARPERPFGNVDDTTATRSSTRVTGAQRTLNRIVAIDDREPGLQRLQEVLNRLLPEVAVECFADARTGLARCVEDPAFDLLIVNGVMAGLTGPELIVDLRKSEVAAGTEPVPIIVTGASGALLLEGLRAGADDPRDLSPNALELAFCVRALFPDAPWVALRI